MKTHVMVGVAPPKESESLKHPHDDKRIIELPMYEQEALTRFIATKNMDWLYFDDTPVTWSRSRQRLLVHTPTGLMGRDTTGRSPQKWLTYDRQHYVGQAFVNDYAVVVEDCFSWLKVHYALQRAGLPVDVFCSLGTQIHDSLMVQFAKRRVQVASFYDGDAAGWEGCAANERRLRAFGCALPSRPTIEQQCAPEGFDPKDMDLGDIVDHVRALLAI